MRLEETITAGEARRVYDWLGARHDMGERFERAAKTRALTLLDLRRGHFVLNAGVGTGKEQRAIQEAIAPTGVAIGVDLSTVMLNLTRLRVAHPACISLSAADIRRLPYSIGSFDRLYCSYVLDLIPAADLPVVLSEFSRVLKSGGRLVTVSLTDGSTIASRAMMAAWKGFYRLSPIALGGCRPVQVSHALLKAGFTNVQRELVVQLGMPSEILVATR